MRIGIVESGCIFSSGIGSEKLFQAVKKGEVCLSEQKSATSNFFISKPFVLTQNEILRVLGKKRKNYSDPQLIYALYSICSCLERSGLDLNTIDKNSFGIFSGVSIPQLQFGLEQVSRTVSSGKISIYTGLAFYFGALVGEASIEYGLKGEGLAVLTDYCSVLDCCGQIISIFEEGYNKISLIIAAEAALYEMAYNNLKSMNLYCKNDFVPYRKRNSGFYLGEGGAALLLADVDYIKDYYDRSKIIAEIASYCSFSNYHFITTVASQKKIFAQAITEGLRKAKLAADEIDLYIGNASGLADEEEAELQAINTIFQSGKMLITTSKPIIGVLGASNALAEIILAVECIKNKFIPAIPGLKKSAVKTNYHKYFDFNGASREIKNVLIVQKSIKGGRVSVLVIKKMQH